MEITEYRISELKDRLIEFTQSKHQKGFRKNKMNRVSGTEGIITKELIVLSLNSQGEKRVEMKNYPKKLGKLPNLGKNTNQQIKKAKQIQSRIKNKKKNKKEIHNTKTHN